MRLVRAWVDAIDSTFKEGIRTSKAIASTVVAGLGCGACVEASSAVGRIVFKIHALVATKGVPGNADTLTIHAILVGTTLVAALPAVIVVGEEVGTDIAVRTKPLPRRTGRVGPVSAA
jgi:hypothetical protein